MKQVLTGEYYPPCHPPAGLTPSVVSVHQLQIAVGEVIAPGTWTFVRSQRVPDETEVSGFKDEYTMQAINAGEAFAGKITAGGSGKLYRVDVYINGTDKEPVNVEAKQLQLSAGVYIPYGSWTLVTRKLAGQETVDEVTSDKYEYTMQVPIWL